VEDYYPLTQLEWQTKVDKPLDLLGFTYSLYPVFTHPAFTGFRQMMTILFLYRVIGLIFFIITKNRMLFIVFANLFVGAFYGLSLAWTVSLPQFRLQLLVAGMVLAWGREFYLHGRGL
jgi:hypothetical protein